MTMEVLESGSGTLDVPHNRSFSVPKLPVFDTRTGVQIRREMNNPLVFIDNNRYSRYNAALFYRLSALVLGHDGIKKYSSFLMTLIHGAYHC